MAPSAARSVPSGSQSKPASTPLSASGSDIPMVIDADSLRAAALRSLKSKRLKADGNNATKPQPPSYPSAMKIRPPPPSMSLDYGDPSPVTTAATTSTIAPVPIPTTSAPIIEDAEKEEGEISEGEDVPPPPPQRHMKAKPTIVVPEKALSEASASTAPMDVDSPQDRIGSITLPAQGVGPPPMAPPDFSAGPALPDPLPASWSSHLASLAAQHSLSLTRVRPDLNVTAAELQEAKDIILDLLGWGVPVQYIHEQQGVSRQLIVYCFDELKLRLPPDFSREGVKPYPPPPEVPPSPSSAMPLTSSYSLPATSRTAPQPSSTKHSNNLPSISPKSKPPTTPTFNHMPTVSTLPRPPTSLPPKPPPTNAAHGRQGSGRFASAAGVPPRPVPQTQTPVPPPPPPPATRGGVDLREIENQRRLELQARKAARTPAPQPETPRVPVPPPPPTTSASVATPPAQIPNVDAFLQDIQQQAITAPPTPQPLHNSRTFGGPVVQSPEPMDIDTGSPALTTTLLPPRSVEPPAPTPQSSPSIPQTNGMKRGVKRPVASDFPDFDNAPPAPRPHSSGRQPVFPLKKRGSFAPQTNFNMIIHLSDTEDESEGDEGGSDGDRPRRTTRKGPVSKKAKIAGARSTPTGQDIKAAESIDAKAAAEAKAKQLAEELQRMKEMILRKEAERARRKANPVGTASPSAELSTSSSAPVTAPVSPRAPRPQPASPIANKSEELDVPKSPTPSSTATPFEQDIAMADADPTSSPDTVDDIAMTLETTTTPHSSPPPQDSDTGKDGQGSSSPSMASLFSISSIHLSN